MSIDRKYLGDFQTPEGRFDIAKFVEFAALFDELIVSSLNLLPQIIRTFGIEGTLKLLNARSLTFLVGAGAIGRSDYIATGFLGDFARKLGPLSWHLEIIYEGAPPPSEMLQRSLKEIKNKLGLFSGDVQKLFDSIQPRMLTPNWKSISAIEDFRHDLRVRPNLIRDFILDSMSLKLIKKISNKDIEFYIQETDKNIFTVHTNLDHFLNKNLHELHKLISPHISSFAGTNFSLGIMAEINALTSLSPDAAKITKKRTDLLGRLLRANDPRETFTRILEIADIPTLRPGTMVNAEKILELQNSKECKEFRIWLKNATDVEIGELGRLLNDWKYRLGSIVRSPTVSVLRWLITTGVSLIEPITGISLSAAEKFMVDRLLPDPGPLAFIKGPYKRLIKKSAK
jgi:hypothetical protein